MNAYADLVSDTALRDDFQNFIHQDLDNTENMINEIFGSPFIDRRPRMNKTLTMREAPLKALHLEQIKLLHDCQRDCQRFTNHWVNALFPALGLAPRFSYANYLAHENLSSYHTHPPTHHL